MKAMNAQVTYSATKVTNARHLPVDRISAGVNLENGVLKLDPLSSASRAAPWPDS